MFKSVVEVWMLGYVVGYDRFWKCMFKCGGYWLCKVKGEFGVV